ncbi:MAG TPA: hypothetical protein PLH15_10550 [Spirochaetota bacterium]|nr:hypothetical protein [Spirochaetota bacterium]HQQ24267.1 hypothetical protein [Spirochaetota bacterium]
MTEKKKAAFEWFASIGVLAVLFLCVGYLYSTKEDKSECDKLEKRVDKVCDEVTSQKELYHGLDKKIDRVLIILEENRLPK